ncbi:MAG: hypothetical protein AAGA65_14780 [Actinomycetota bacterium]
MRTATKSHRAGNAGHRSPLRIAVAALLMTAVAVTGVSAPADATDISIPFDELVFGQPGSTVTIATVAVSAEMVGRTCNLVVLAENQSSVHPGNDLIVSTGGSQAVIFGVEDTANGGTSETYQMVVGSTILVQLRIGQDGMSSLGFDLSFDCQEPVVEVTTTTILQQVVTTTVPTDCAAVGATQTTGADGAGSGAATDGSATADGCTPDCTDTTGASGTGDGSGATQTTVADGAGSTTGAAGCEPDCTGATPGAGAADGGSTATVAGQAGADAGTPTTVCATAQVTSSTAVTTTTVAVTPTVAGSATNQLPETPAADAVAGAPSYTG